MCSPAVWELEIPCGSRPDFACMAMTLTIPPLPLQPDWVGLRSSQSRSSTASGSKLRRNPDHRNCSADSSSRSAASRAQATPLKTRTVIPLAASPQGQVLLRWGTTAMGYITKSEAHLGNTVYVRIRKNAIPAEVVRPGFPEEIDVPLKLYLRFHPPESRLLNYVEVCFLLRITRCTGRTLNWWSSLTCCVRPRPSVRHWRTAWNASNPSHRLPPLRSGRRRPHRSS